MLAVSSEVNVSRLRGPQSESAIAIDPRNPHVVLAGSNDIRARRMAVYSSIDGGRHWSSGHLPVPPGVGPYGNSVKLTN